MTHEPLSPPPARQPRSRPVPTWRLVPLAVAGAVVVATWPGAAGVALVGVNAVLLAGAALSWLRLPHPAVVAVRRDLPAVAALGSDVELTWTVHNPTASTLEIAVADELAPSLRAGTRRVRLPVPAAARARAGTRLRPARRGRFAPTEVVVRVARPWGLMARQAPRALPALLRVYPSFGSRDQAELRIEKARILEVGLRSAQGRGSGTEFDALREYGIDDESRRIDWAATARAGKPIVRTYRAERNQTVLVLLDTGRMMAGRVHAVDSPASTASPATAGIGPLPRLDHGMDAAMMLTAVATRVGDRAGLVAFSDGVRSMVPPGHRHDQLQRVTEALYRLEPELVESDYRGAFAQTLARFRRRALLVLVTELAEEAARETLVPALPLLARDHVVIVAALRDPEVSAWAASAPVEAGAAYRKAAAAQALQARRATVAHLRGLGAMVVDEPPGRLAPALADAYLGIKATGRL